MSISICILLIRVSFIGSCSLVSDFWNLLSFRVNLLHGCVTISPYMIVYFHVFKDYAHRSEFIILMHDLIYISSLRIFDYFF